MNKRSNIKCRKNRRQCKILPHTYICITGSRKKEISGQNTSLPLTTTMVNSKTQKNSNKNPTLPPGLQNSSQHVGECPDPLNLISRTSSKAGKQVHSRKRP